MKHYFNPTTSHDLLVDQLLSEGLSRTEALGVTLQAEQAAKIKEATYNRDVLAKRRLAQYAQSINF